MENSDQTPSGKGVAFLGEGMFVRIALLLTSLGISRTHHSNTDTARAATVIIGSKQTGESIELTPSEMQQLLNKFENRQFDGDWSDSSTATTPSEQMKLFKHQCGECYWFEYRKFRIRIDQDVIHKLLHFEEKMKSFLEFDDNAVFAGSPIAPVW